MAIDEADKIGMSKKVAREQKQRFIHSYNQKDKCEKIGYEFANFCRDNYKINKLFKAKEEQYQHFLNTKKETSKGHQRNIETALRLVQSGMQQRAEKFGKETTQFCTEERLIPTATRNENVADRSYTSQEINDIKAHTSNNTETAVDLMSHLGLRLGETVHARKQNIDFERGIFHVVGGKGGKNRNVPISADYLQKLENITQNKEGTDQLVPTQATVISNDCKQAADKLNMQNWTGTHGFRHSYARGQINEKMTHEEKQLFDKCLSNYAENKSFNYAIRPEQKELYHAMKSKMDSVHHNLGHGANRFDLALRYMA